MAVRKNDTDQDLDQSRPSTGGRQDEDRLNNEDELDTRTVSNDVEEGDEDYVDEEEDDELDEEDFEDDAEEDVDEPKGE